MLFRRFHDAPRFARTAIVPDSSCLLHVQKNGACSYSYKETIGKNKKRINALIKNKWGLHLKTCKVFRKLAHFFILHSLFVHMDSLTSNEIGAESSVRF